MFVPGFLSYKQFEDGCHFIFAISLSACNHLINFFIDSLLMTVTQYVKVEGRVHDFYH